MPNCLFPNRYLPSVYNIDFNRLYSRGYRVVLFDIDNTLVPHNAKATSAVRNFFKRLKDTGFKTALISNNKKPRVEEFAKAVGCDGFFYKSAKPSPRAYIKLVQSFNLEVDKAVFVGDQIFTDILGANRANIYSVMVEPVLKWHEEPQIILKRLIEAPVVLLYKLRRSRMIKKSQ